MKVLTVVGNRPQFVKAAAVSHRLRERADEVLVHTGQHYDRQLSEIFFEELGLPPADHLLGIGSGSHAEQTAAIITRLEPLLDRILPDAVLVYGDTNSTLGGALVAARARPPLVHVEAGMRSGSLDTPEEVNRLVTDSLADLRLCSTELALRNLESEGLVSGAQVVGDVMADVALTFGPIAERRSSILESLGLNPGSYCIATAHRAENVDHPERLRQLVEVLARVAESVPVVFPVHPRTRARLDATGTFAQLLECGIRPIDPIGYLDMLRLLNSARALLTDSGGLQKEAFIASVPCLTMRERTEWEETVDLGWNLLIGLDPDAAVAGLERLPAPHESKSDAIEIYGAGRAGERVADAVVAIGS